MSVDTRVVKMQFDNKQFEENVSKSMTTLDKLEEQLQFKKSSKGLSALQQGIDSVKFDKLLNGIESINSKLSATGIVAAKFVSSIADSVVAGVKKVEQASIGQMKTGGWNRAMNIENAKFAVEGLKGDWDQLYKAMDYAVTGTAYGIDQAAKAASTLMASSVDYTKTIEKNGNTNITQMHKALRAISGVAAQTNSQFDDIAHIFTTVAGNGRLMSEQLNQLSGRGMNAAAILGEQLHMTEAEIREATSKGKIDFATFANAMDKAFGEHATDANKTFTGSLSNMKAALSRFGAVFATPIIQNTNKFFIALTDKIKEMKSAISDVTENGEVLEKHLEGHFADAWKNLIELSDTLVHSIDLTWFKETADSLDRITESIGNTLATMNEYAKTFTSSSGGVAKTLWNLATITKEEKDVAEMVIRGAFGNGAKRKKALEQYIKDNELNMNPDKIQAYVNAVSKYGYSFDKAKIKVSEFTEQDEKALEEQKTVKDVFQNVIDTIDIFNSTLKNVKGIISDFAEAAGSAFGGLSGILYRASDGIKDLTWSAWWLSTKLKPSENELKAFYDQMCFIADIVDDVIGGLKKGVHAIRDFIVSIIETWRESGVLEQAIQNMTEVIRNLYMVIRNLATTAARIFGAIAKAFFKVFNPAKATGLLAGFTNGLEGLSEKFLLSEEAAEVLSDVFVDIFTVVDKIITKISELIIKITEFLAGFKSVGEEGEDVGEAVTEVGDSVEETGEKFGKIAETATKVKDFFVEIGENFKKLMDLLKENEGIKNLKESLEKLGNTFKDSVHSGMDSFKEGLSNINQEAGTSITVEDVADAIGKFANNLAKVVDEIPGAITKIEEFFKKAYTKGKEFFDKVSKSEIWKSFKNFFGNLYDFSSDIVTNIKNLFSSVGDSISKGLEKISWKDVLESGFVLGAIAFVLQLAKLTDTINDVFNGVSGVIKGIGSIFKNFGNLISNIGKNIDKLVNATLIFSIVSLILALGAVVYVLAQIPTEDLNNAASVLIILGTVFGLLIAKILDRIIKQKMIKKLSGADLGKQVLIDFVGKIIAFSVAIWLLSNALKILIDGMTKVVEVLSKYKSDALSGAMLQVAFMFGTLLAGTAAIILFSKYAVSKLDEGSDEALAVGVLVAAMAVSFIAIGSAILLLAVAAEKIAAVGQDADRVFDAVWKILITMLGGVAIIMFLSRSIDPDSLVSIGVLLLEIIVAMMIIFAGIYVLAAAMSGSDMLGKFTGVDEKITQATLLVCAVIATLAVSVMLISLSIQSVLKHGKNMEGAGGMVAGMLIGMIVMVGIVSVCTVMLAKQVRNMNTEQIKAIVLLTVMMTAALISIAVLVDHISKLVTSFGGNVKNLGYGALLILSLGGMMLMILGGIAAIISLVGAYSIKPEEVALVFLGIIAMVALLSILLWRMTQIAKDGVDPDALNVALECMLGAALAVVLISLAVAIIAKSYQGLDATAMIAMAGTFLLALAFVGVMAHAITSFIYNMRKTTLDPNDIKMIRSIGLVMLAMAGAVLIVVASAALLKSMGVTFGEVMEMIAIIAIISVLLYAMSALFGMDNGLGHAASAGLLVIAEGLKGIGLAFLIFGAAIVVAAIGLAKLNPVLLEFASVFNVICGVVEQHSGVVIGLAIFIVVVLLIVGAVLLKTLPIVDKIVTAITKGIIIVWEIIKEIGGKIKDVATKFFGNKQISNKLKAGVVTIIISLASAITESGPVVLQKIGEFLWMIIDWIIGIIPKLADKLFDILMSLVWGLLDALTSHINEIEAALKAIIVTIGAILGKLIMDLIADILDAIDWAVGGLISNDFIEGIRESGDEFIAASRTYAEGVKEAAKIRDKAIKEGTVAETWATTELLGAPKASSRVSESAELVEAETKRTVAFKKYISAQKALGNEVDLSKEFLYMKKDTETISYEQDKLIEQGLAYRDAAGIFYRIRRENAELLSTDPLSAKYYDYDYIYNQTEANVKKESSLMDRASSLLKDKGSDLKDTASEFLGNVIPSTDDTSGGVANIADMYKEMGEAANVSSEGMSIDPSTMIDQNAFKVAGYDTGYGTGTAQVTGQTDALSDGTPQLVMMNNKNQEKMGDEAASTYTDAYSSSMVSSSNKKQVEKSADAVVETQTDRIKDPENQALYKDAANESINSFTDQYKYTATGKGIVASGYLVAGLKIPLEQFADADIHDSRTAAHYMYNICKTMAGTIDTYFENGSPSKLMQRTGGFIIQGLTRGLYDEEGNAISGMSDISNAMLNSFTSPLDYIAKVASGEYQYDPSIRPVLDTSMVRAGANGINSMFNHQNVTLNGLSGTLAADIGQLDGSNMEIIRELRSLRGDLTEMGDKIAGMQVVMDSGRLVGAIAPDMDRALGSRVSSNYRGKGN